MKCGEMSKLILIVCLFIILLCIGNLVLTNGTKGDVNTNAAAIKQAIEVVNSSIQG